MHIASSRAGALEDDETANLSETFRYMMKTDANVETEDNVSELRITTRNVENMHVGDLSGDTGQITGQITSGRMENQCLSSSQRLLNNLAEMSELLMSEKMVCVRMFLRDV